MRRASERPLPAPHPSRPARLPSPTPQPRVTSPPEGVPAGGGPPAPGGGAPSARDPAGGPHLTAPRARPHVDVASRWRPQVWPQVEPARGAGRRRGLLVLPRASTPAAGTAASGGLGATAELCAAPRPRDAPGGESRASPQALHVLAPDGGRTHSGGEPAPARSCAAVPGDQDRPCSYVGRRASQEEESVWNLK